MSEFRLIKGQKAATKACASIFKTVSIPAMLRLAGFSAETLRNSHLKDLTEGKFFFFFCRPSFPHNIRHFQVGKNSTNDRVWRLLWCPDDVKDVLKRFSTPNYLQFGPNWVQIGRCNPEIEELESFEEDGQEFNERPRLEPRVVSG